MQYSRGWWSSSSKSDDCSNAECRCSEFREGEFLQLADGCAGCVRIDIAETFFSLHCRLVTFHYPIIHWQEAGAEYAVRWRSEAGVAPPEVVVVADDTLKADEAYRLAAQGTAILWRGDYQNARKLLQALARRRSSCHSHRRAPSTTTATRCGTSGRSRRRLAAQAASANA